MGMTEYDRINRELSMHERGRGSHTVGISWITDRIDWAWKFRKITSDQKDELCDRVIAHLEDYGAYAVL